MQKLLHQFFFFYQINYKTHSTNFIYSFIYSLTSLILHLFYPRCCSTTKWWIKWKFSILTSWGFKIQSWRLIQIRKHRCDEWYRGKLLREAVKMQWWASVNILPSIMWQLGLVVKGHVFISLFSQSAVEVDLLYVLWVLI